MRQIMILAAFLLFAGMALARMAEHTALYKGPAQPRDAASDSFEAKADTISATPANSRTVTVSRGADGHFQVEARVDGRRIEFLVDTGASHIALRESDAARLGIHPARSDYKINVSTANGITRAALVRLGMVEVEDIILRDLPALVHPDQALGVNLLGMSFLSKVRWAYDRGKLVLEQ